MKETKERKEQHAEKEEHEPVATVAEVKKADPAEKGASMMLAPLTTPRAIIWNGLMIAVAVLAAAFIIVHGITAGTQQAAGAAASAASAGAADPSTAADAPAPSATPDATKVVTSDEPFIGNANAPVTLDYWSDYQCPFCREFETQTLPTIIQNYVSTGKVKVVFKDFSFLGPDSTTAALYARAVWNLYPSQFFAWRTAMFEDQASENSGFDDAANIQKRTATISGINVAKVVAAVAANSATYQKELDADREEAASYGIEGTPSFITGTKLIAGVMPYSTFQSDFDAQLK